MQGRDRLLVLGILVVYASFFHIDPGWNVASRLGLVYSVVDHGTLAIDHYHEATGDKAFYEGRFYSDKAVGHAVPGVPVYAVARLTLTPLGARPGSAVYHYLLKTALVSLPSALACLILLNLVRLYLPDGRWSRGLIAAFALGTLALPYSTVYYSHQQVAVALLAALAVARGEARWWRSVAVGSLIGYAFLLEYPTLLAGGVVAVYHLAENRKPKTVAAMLAGAVPAVLLFGAYNWACFGSPWSTGYSHKYLPYLAHVHGAGFMGLSRPSPAKLVSILFAPKGLASASPFLILALPGVVVGRKHRQLWAAAAVAVVLLLFNASVIWEPFGGWTPGPRYAVPAIPFLILLCAAALARWRAARLLLVGGGLTGLLYNGLAAAVDVHVPEEVGTPLTHYLLPLARHGCLRGAGALALLVVLVGLVLVAASLVRRPSQGATRPQSSRPAAWLLCAVLLAACWGCLLRPVNTAWGRYHLGCALLECGDPGEAELRLRESVADDPDLQPAHSLLGRLYASQGDTAAATRHLTRALELRGSDEEARRALQALQAPAPESRP